MTNEVAAGRTTEAVRRWRQLVQMDSSAEFRAVTWLVMWLEKVRKALALQRAGRKEFDIAKELKIWPASAAGPFLQTAARVGEAGAAKLIDRLAEVDQRSKSGLGEMAENVERFLLSIAQSV
jgi:DNA polymerase III delta subunit